MSAILTSDSMTAIKARARRRARGGERGAIIFIVAMTVAVLATIGLYGLTSAATEARASTYERQSSQTHYLANYAGQAAMQALFPNLTATQTYTGMQGGQYLLSRIRGLAPYTPGNAPWSCTTPPCTMCDSLTSAPQNAPWQYNGCYRLTSGMITNPAFQYWPAGAIAIRTPDSTPAAGPLGGYNYASPSLPAPAVGPTGDFFAEFSDLQAGGLVPGGSSNSSVPQCYYSVLLSAYGKTTPSNSDLSAQGLESGKGHIIGSATCSSSQ